MAEEWKLKHLERKIDSLQEQFTDAERRAQKEKEQARRRHADRITWWLSHLAWTAYVITMTAYVVLAATGSFPHH